MFKFRLIAALMLGAALALSVAPADAARDKKLFNGSKLKKNNYDAWLAGPHHQAATCNDCHTPAGFVGKYWVKATNGYHHSKAFTFGGYPDVLRARPESSAVVEANCRHCHADLVDSMPGGGAVSCIRCHASVGHQR